VPPSSFPTALRGKLAPTFPLRVLVTGRSLSLGIYQPDESRALAAFIAVGITVLGFLSFGRRWWGLYLVIASVVLLTLLLAPDAYVAFGLAFVLILAAALAATVAAHLSTTSSTELRPPGLYGD
jgi:hypothetical protein